jgi:hypothetical protein
MNSEEAKFILRNHRADGRYAPDDPVFREALAEVERSPELAAWFAGEHTFDETVANKIDAIQPPPGLRETILAGARASRLGRRWWQNPFWLVAAAAIVVISTLIPFRSSDGSTRQIEHALAELALNDAGNKDHQHGSPSPAAKALFASLRDGAGPLTAAGNAPDFATMREAGCKSFTLDGREVYEVCVVRNGRWFHLYATRRTGPSQNASSHPTITERGRVAVATWSTDTTIYTLASASGRDALSGLI